MSFPTTRWTVLAEATLHGDPAGREALAQICMAYHAPVMAYLEGRGMDTDAARDMAQDFFLKLLHSQALKRADRQRGRFRSFLLGILNHVVQQTLRHNAAFKRGGGIAVASLDALADEGVELAAPEDSASVNRFDCAWARSLVVQAMHLLETEYLSRGAEREFAVLRQFLPGSQVPPSYEEAGNTLGLNPNSLKSSIHRLRQRFREQLRILVGRTVSAPHEVDDELRYLGTLLIQSGKSPQSP